MLPRSPKVDIDELLSVLDKAESGPIVEEKEWDQKYIHQTVSRLVKEFDISFDVQEPGVPSDDSLADRLFEAGMRLAIDSGVLCTDTHRRLVWTREELERILARVPDVVRFGEGPRAAEIHRRLPDQDARVLIGGGPWGVVVPEELFLPLTTAYVQDEAIDFFCTASLKTTYGRPVRAQSPWDIVGCWQEVRLTHAALELAGRPGMVIAAPNTTASAIGTVSTVTGAGLRYSDYNNNSFMSELKVSYQDLIRTCHFVETGSLVHNFYNPVYGGYVGGAEGVAVAIVAGIILMRACLFGDAFNPGPPHVHLSCNTFPPLIPAQAVAFQALSRNTNLAIQNFTRPLAGPGEEDLLYEIAAFQIATVPCGVGAALGVQTATGRHEAHCSPLEVHFMAEVAHAAEKLTRKDADGLVRQLIQIYRDGQKTPRAGKAFQEVYDLETLQPTADWRATYETVCTHLAEIGLPLSTTERHDS